MKKLVLLLCLLVAVPVFAQDRPISGTTVQTTDTTANSLLVGCAIGSTTCTGGIKSGPILAAAGTFSGVLTVNGFGTHNFSAGSTGANTLQVTNTSSGTGNFARFIGVAGTVGGYFDTFSQGYTTSGSQIQSGARLLADSAGGLALDASHASGTIKFFTVGTLRWAVNNAGDWTFGASSHIADSSGTPAITLGGGVGGTIGGQDYAFVVTFGTGSPTTVTVGFGHTWTTTPVCVTTNDLAFASGLISLSTTQIVVGGGTYTNGSHVWVHCRSY